MRSNESQSFSQLNVPVRVLKDEPPVLISGEFVGSSTQPEWFWPKRPVRRKCLQSRVNDPLAARTMNDGGQHKHRRGEIIVNIAAASTNTPIFDIHENIRSGLQFR